MGKHFRVCLRVQVPKFFKRPKSIFAIPFTLSCLHHRLATHSFCPGHLLAFLSQPKCSSIAAVVSLVLSLVSQADFWLLDWLSKSFLPSCSPPSIHSKSA